MDADDLDTKIKTHEVIQDMGIVTKQLVQDKSELVDSSGHRLEVIANNA